MAFTPEGIKQGAPEASGLYGIFASHWVFVADADNMRQALFHLLDAPTACMQLPITLSFSWENVPPSERRARLGPHGPPNASSTTSLSKRHRGRGLRCNRRTEASSDAQNPPMPSPSRTAKSRSILSDRWARPPRTLTGMQRPWNCA